LRAILSAPCDTKATRRGRIVAPTDLLAVVDQGTGDGEQAGRRQVIVGNSAADRGMRHVHQQNAHDACS